MNGKSQHDALTGNMGSHLLNPFVHKLELDNAYDKIKTAIFTVVLLPFRVVVICLLLTLAWMLACIGLYGMSEDELRQRPMTGWRRALKPLLCQIGRWSYLAGGMAITVKGCRAPRREAPILVVAPHSSFLDSVIVYVTHMSTVIVRKESMDNYAGKLINYTQPIYVWRDDPNSRVNTIKEIIDRATSSLDWPQVLIFPEGTTTNRSCLITFKPGAFYPGVPVQPVCIRYPNKLDTVTWTWEGPGALKLLWLTLTQVHSACEIEFLPVYHPNIAEKADPKLFARNVRNVMARALGIPVSDYTYDDCKLMSRAKQINLPYASSIVEVEKLRRILGLDRTNPETRLIKENSVNEDQNSWRMTPEEFAYSLQVSPLDSAITSLFSLFDKNGTGVIDFREYLVCALFIIKSTEPTIELLQLAFKMFDRSGCGHLTLQDFYDTARHTLTWSVEECDAVFQQIDHQHRSYITYDQFRAFIISHPEYAYVYTSFDDVPTHNHKLD